MNPSLTTYSNQKELYIIIIGKLSGSLYHLMPSYEAYIFQGNQLDAARTFGILAAEDNDMTVRQYITEKYIEGCVDEEEPRQATNEEVDKYLLEMTVSNLSDDYFHGYDKFEVDKWKELDIPICPLKDDIEFKYD